ncbi:Hsp20/alpha crystallin family protein [Spiroplasma endosymbiont of Zeiraphera isertana]|uniref:Hsp20/alpha crystallin family protein n=1 Tax=Spiroplasma endosymbiont of Zeiraphera isertana TaxID=3066313 RepID=UPI00313EE1B8
MKNEISKTKNKLDVQNNFSRRNYLTDIFDNFFNDIINFSYPLTFKNDGERTFLPKTDVFENDSEYCLEIELPGVLQENIDLKINNNILTIEAKKDDVNEKKNKNYHIQERYYGSFSRSINLPSNISEESIDANFKNGILIVKIPKKEQTKTKKITIK